jgi:bifunctional non-homologous end joining protein LigD
VHLLDQLDALEQRRPASGVLELPDGDRFEVTNLSKVYWPKGKLTKGDLMRHYVRASKYILPVLDKRPLVLKRFPNGVAGQQFYQHRAGDRLPANVDVATIQADDEERPHLIGGALKTLLYTSQLAAISQDPWFSRIGSDEHIDHVAIDLDPPDGLPFARVRDVARWVGETLDSLGITGFPKTSGAGGLHIYVQMAPKTSFDTGFLFAQIVATAVADAHPKLATVERSIKARGKRVYVDYMQNVRGKTLASAYSARASEFAGVSTPLTWQELETDVVPKDFTIANFESRMKSVGDLWARLRKAKGADLRGITKRRGTEAQRKK